MISVLIPVYNTVVFSLVQELSKQVSESSIEAEIIVVDDYSAHSIRVKNQLITSLPWVYYTELEKNYGRIEIRKHLAGIAKGEWLLFIDGDSKIIEKNFLQKYSGAIHTDADVAVGGRVYPDVIPEKCLQRLHWTYGNNREQRKRSAFQSNNFCIRKITFEELVFPDDIKGYGHEDTWIGIQLDLLQKRVLPIHNPVLHEGIEEASVFLNKSLQALHNLFLLSKITSPDLLCRHVRLYKWFYLLKKYRLTGMVELFYAASKKGIMKNLSSCHPSLVLFDIFRLYHFIQLTKRQY